MNAQLREQAVNLRVQEQLSYSEIKKRLGVAKSTLSGWLQDFSLSEEKILELRRAGWQKGEASRERFRNTMRQKRELKEQKVYQKYREKFTTLSSDAFFLAGLMLYAAEGDKKNSSRLALANTDIQIIKFFIKWLQKFFGVQVREIKVELHLYENMDIEKEKDFWKQGLGFLKEQFYKTQIRKLQKSSFSYKESYRHGTCGVYVFGVSRNREVMMGIKAMLNAILIN